jgi:hypothetical protein
LTAAVRSSAEDIDLWALTDAEDCAGRAPISLQERLSRTGVQGGACLQGESRTDAPEWLTTTAQGARPQAAFAVVAQTIQDDFPSPAATECAQLVAVARFTKAVDALCGEYSPRDVAEVAPAGSAAGDESCSEGLSFNDETGPQDQLTDDGIAQVEAHLSAQVDPIPDETAVRPADDIQRALLQVREHIQAVEQSSERAVERLAESTAEARRHLTPEFKSAGTVKRLGVEIARIVDVMEARFERTEVASAKRVAELGAEIRQEIAQMIDALAARVSDLEQRTTQAAVDVGDQRLPSSGSTELDVGPQVVAWDPTEVVLGTGLSTVGSYEEATDSADGTTTPLPILEAASERPSAWQAAACGTSEQAHADNVQDADPEPDPAATVVCALDQTVEREHDPSPGRRESSIFAWLGFRPSRPFRTQPVGDGKLA